MREEQIHIPTRGSMVFTRLWHAKENSRGTVLIVHDSAEHSQRYQNFALFLTHHGYSVVAYDLRGHGFSALNSAARDNRLVLKKGIVEYPDFGYMPAKDGWSVYLDDFSNVLKYIFSRYSDRQYFLFGHGLGTMIISASFAVLSRKLLKPLTAALLSAPPPAGGLRAAMLRKKINNQIKRYGEGTISPQIEKMLSESFANSKKFSFLRTDLDWISSQAEEVDEYIADPLCGNTLRLGLYKAIMEGRRFVYSAARHHNSFIRQLPLFIFSGKDDPASGYGKGPAQLGNALRGSGWNSIETRLYSGRHDLLHDWVRSDLYGDCLDWMNKQK